MANSPTAITERPPISATTTELADIGAEAQAVDARPILIRDATSIWARATTECSRLYQRISSFCTECNVDTLVLKSNAEVHPTWVEWECWLRSASLTERIKLTITVQPKPCHRYEIEYVVGAVHRGKKPILRKFSRLDNDMLAALIRSLLTNGSLPKFAGHRLRSHRYQFWLPKNRLVLLRPDVVDWFFRISLITGVLFGLLLAFQPGGAAWIVLFGTAALYGGWRFYRRGQRRLIFNDGKPVVEPRYLRLADYWHVVLPGLGIESDPVRARFLAMLDERPRHEIRHAVETVAQRGPDGKEEREQVVLSFRRGLVFCQFHAYGTELYLGWDAYLNTGQWVEQEVDRGVDRRTGRLVVINTVVPGQQRLSEYDLIDLNYLIEWTHARMTELVKILLEEYKIDQEIDFKIQRAERPGISEADNQDEGTRRRSNSSALGRMLLRRSG